MSQDKKQTEKVKEEIKDVSDKIESAEAKKEERKKAIRRAELEYHGGTHLDDKYKKPGKVYRAVADTPGRIKFMESMGYDIVRDDDFKSGSDHSGTHNKLGAAQTLEMGKRTSQPGVWMECDKDIYDERLERKHKANVAMFEDTVEDNQRTDQKGKKV